ncbi:MAG: hypothetical protein RMJ43_11250 [Chloroherpetonaceae bacterium]|nr:hypothetical protein [Chthonomonadaceae bacterium]MDW8208405.1 hypothetical protein [Chloroherpetonaceae bacterium]
MSLDAEGRWILCDGAGCGVTVPLPVALPGRDEEGHEPENALHGWLFVVHNGKALHFCPRCALAHLAILSHTDVDTPVICGTQPM